MITRRQFLKLGAHGTGLLLITQAGLARRVDAIPLPGGSLDPLAIPKFVAPLVVPPAMPRTAKLRVKRGKNIDYYEIAVRQFDQQILPAGFPRTTVWSYGSPRHPGSFNYPAFTIEAKWRAPVRVKWINQLVDAQGRALPHLLPIDQTLHWANPPGGIHHRDGHGEDPAPYQGPVPIVTHVHGAHTTDESDGYAEAWYLPAATDIPSGYATVGTWYEAFRRQFRARKGVAWTPGSATFEYPNDQAAATLWYHDHTLGMTRNNVYAGPAGFFLLRGGPLDEVIGRLPGPGPALGDPAGMRYYEIPIAIQDRAFEADGSLFYPDTRAFFDGFAGPYAPASDIAPIWNPEFFGNVMVVNGRSWPVLDVEPRRYRFRLLNGCNSRFLILRMSRAGLPFWQIGAEGGFLPTPVALEEILMAPAERADVIVDFSGIPVGTEIVLENLAPDEPFGGGVPGEDFAPADPDTTGRVMKFRVVPLAGRDRSTPPSELGLPVQRPLPPAARTRRVSLNELDSEQLEEVGPRTALLGTVAFDPDGRPQGVPLGWEDVITENPAIGATEIWEIFNFTADAHPIHVHQVQFEVVNREVFDAEIGTPGSVRLPEPGETGPKDTVIAYPGEITRIRARFDLPGLYVWHCHIVEHEDHEMMRPFAVGIAPVPMT
jgi:FtsP/CotA-like multicopper oxidase with cupredoxin domain